MALLEVLTVPNKKLKEKGVEITEFDEKLHTFLDDMAETMYAENGIGLSATQVGVALNVATVDVASRDEPSQLLELVNPKIVEREGRVVSEEGCLSVPGVWEEVERSEKIKVEYQDRHGEKQSLEADEMLSICIQHELDHLDGKVFIDYLSKLKRKLAVKKAQREAVKRKEERG